MTTVDESLHDPATAPPRSAFWDRLDRITSRASEWVNPILVKETRQALKSRQFLVTFCLLLVCGWLWSISVIVITGPGIYWGASGSSVFMGYFSVLCFPMLVIVPFGAYRSLASEWEDGTYDLMSISLLNARQIVTGKLGSAILQMVVYLSALAPCLAFTYMLRGIDVLTIMYLLFWLAVDAVFATFLALALATVTRSKAWQVMVAVLLIAICLFNLYLALGFSAMAIFSPFQMLQFDDPYLWIASGGMLTGVVGYAVMFLMIARARLMFECENRSTALRVIMLAHQAVFAAWMAWGWLFEERFHPMMLVMFLIFSGIHWWLMGCFMTGEAAQLSPRVKRDLPQSFLGRVFFTLFNPGSGTGYLFAVSSFLAVALLAVVGQQIAGEFVPISKTGFRGRAYYGVGNLAVVGVCYLTIYLGVGRLIIRGLRSFTHIGLLAGALIHIGMFIAGNLIPLSVQAFTNRFVDDYTLLQFMAPIWTVYECVEDPHNADILWTKVYLLVLAFVVFAINLPSVAREIQQLRVARPKRVQEEDAQLHPQPQPEPSSPWG